MTARTIPMQLTFEEGIRMVLGVSGPKTETELLTYFKNEHDTVKEVLAKMVALGDVVVVGGDKYTVAR